MKKLYILAAAMLTAGAMNAETLSFLDGETPVANGETITFTELNEEDVADYGEAKFEPKLYLTTDYVTGELTAIAECTSGQEISFCFGGNCMAGATVTKEHESIKPGDKVALMYDVMFYDVTPDYEYPVVSTIISVTDNSNPSTATTMTVVFDKTSNSIKAVETGKKVTVANGALAYVLDGAATLNVYNTAGNRVFTAALEGNGSLDAQLAPGLYVYTLAGETGKFVVR